MTLITQFGGGKTHTLTALYHLVTAGKQVGGLEGVTALLREAGLAEAPAAKVAVFVWWAFTPLSAGEWPCVKSPGARQ
jgi:hypothetical protein